MNTFRIALANSRLNFYSVRVKKRPVVPAVDVSKSQKYFDATFRHGDGFLGLVSDIEVLNDSSTPDMLKQYIQQHSCAVVHHQKLSHDITDNSSPSDMVPTNIQTFGELQNYLEQNQIEL